jgi:hypothetical protein
VPRVAIPITAVPITGIAPPAQVTGNPAEDHSIDPGSGPFLLECQNIGTGEAHTVTVRTPGKVDGVDIEEIVCSVPKEAIRWIRLEGRSAFRQEDGNIYVDVASAELKFRAYRA